ncbi:MAG: transglycosylase SLT domain-containing protein [Pseudomonadota bacterium]
MRFVLFFLVSSFLLAACSTTPPTAAEQVDICDIFDNRKSWYRASARAERKWGVPVTLQMAIIKQESSFDKDARPPRGRRRFFGLARGRRPSSARGYAQALDSTWDEYQSSTGNRGASRSDFSDSVDFIGWYVSRAARQTGTSVNDARSQYLAYHEGPGGFSRGTWRGNSALIRTANGVASDTSRFQVQLNGCERRLKRRGIFG